MNESCKVAKLAVVFDDLCAYLDRVDCYGYPDEHAEEELEKVCDEMRIWANKWFDWFGHDQYGLNLHKC